MPSERAETMASVPGCVPCKVGEGEGERTVPGVSAPGPRGVTADAGELRMSTANAGNSRMDSVVASWRWRIPRIGVSSARSTSKQNGDDADASVFTWLVAAHTPALAHELNLHVGAVGERRPSQKNQVGVVDDVVCRVAPGEHEAGDQ
jgi:hypothetical protein